MVLQTQHGHFVRSDLGPNYFNGYQQTTLEGIELMHFFFFRMKPFRKGEGPGPRPGPPPQKVICKR